MMVGFALLWNMLYEVVVIKLYFIGIGIDKLVNLSKLIPEGFGFKC